ncbi:hypothetical protein P175DRAFT_0436187 [Aspergillus ochraceoroseus IBT 24754]|uniref:Aminoglycoside phosphotransferase domain-containing protein n=2 Tax=Aspergillus ochraceoroseus TaxID=138278 RepID=A0A2T5LZP0_9EURO|nr:uncharacterized protein P175DRAFT_0436187 [Aspergillus ochraceoroseus IBT 24754]KKK19558.1 hypothetical protein AOCH_005081 [Aspergillus ochraceoroseus]PTU21747.1 hypothetical protein P175DRAFT_0436187 [Aspergillus ochraceoroseus IBT 24754]
MSPLQPAPPELEAEVSEKLGAILQRHFLLPVHVTRVYPMAGHLHSLYLVRLSNETHVLLKCAPRPTTPLLRWEHVSLETEARALSLLNQSTLPYTPLLLHYDPLGTLLGPSCLVRHHIPGSTLEEIETQLTSQEKKAIDRSLGLLARRMGQHISDSFGSLGQVAAGGGKRSWREAFLILLEGILRDSEDVFVNLPYAEIRHRVSWLSPALDEVVLPRLVMIDFGQPSQVLVDPDSKRLCGISGFGNAVWGDLFMAKLFDRPSAAMLDGFGSSDSKAQLSRVRQLLYSCYRSIHQITSQYYRNHRNSTAEIDARRQLMTTLGEMAAT